MKTEFFLDLSGDQADERFQKLRYMLDTLEKELKIQLQQKDNLKIKLVAYDSQAELDASPSDDDNGVDILPVANGPITNSLRSLPVDPDTNANDTPATNTNSIEPSDLRTGKVNEARGSCFPTPNNDNRLASTSIGGGNQNNLPARNIVNENLTLIETEILSVKGLHEIGGLRSIKAQLFTLVVLPKLQPQLFCQMKRCCTVLLYGPPGTGKTRLVHGLAAESGAAFISLSVRNILSPFVGETEQNIGQLFDYLRATKTYTLLFIDEIDSLCRDRNSSEADHTRRTKTELMCQLNRMENSRNCVIIAATNCPWDLDAAFLRRFQKHIFVPLPTAAERMELFQILAEGIPIIQNREQFDELIRITEGFTGSDIANLVNDAVHKPFDNLQSVRLWKTTPDGKFEPIFEQSVLDMTDLPLIEVRELRNLPPGSVTTRPVTIVDFLEAAKQVHVTVTAEHLEKYNNYRK